jgi:hypothetical protein
LDNLEITDLNTKMWELWDGVEAPVMIFARAHKYDHQLECHKIPKQPELRLSYAISTYQISGQFDAAMQEWHAKLLANKTFPNFCVYMTEFPKMIKQNRSTTRSVGKGVANKVTKEKLLDAKAQAMVIAEVVNVLQAQNTEQMKNMITMFEKLLASTHAPAVPSIVNPPKAPHQPQKESPHCSKKHANQNKCWELGDAIIEAETHPLPISGVKHKDVYLRVFDTTKKAMYTNQPSCFPITSTGGHEYTMVAAELDRNYIDAEPMKP